MNLAKQALDELLVVYGTKATEPWLISSKVIQTQAAIKKKKKKKSVDGVLCSRLAVTAEYSVFQGHATVMCCYKCLARFPGLWLSS